MTRFSKAAASLAGGVALTAIAAVPAFGFTASPVTSLVSPSDVSGTSDVVEVVAGPADGPDVNGNFNPNPNSGDSLTINFSGFAAVQSTFKAFLCNPKANTAVYDGTTDCIDLAPGAPVSTATGAGVFTNVRVGDGAVGLAENNLRNWECVAAPTGSPTGVSTTTFNGDAVKIYSDCFVVVRKVGGAAGDSDTNPANNELFPVRFVAGSTTPPPTDVPEAPFAALLPAAALAVAGGGYLIVRRRGTAAA